MDLSKLIDNQAEIVAHLQKRVLGAAGERDAMLALASAVEKFCSLYYLETPQRPQ